MRIILWITTSYYLSFTFLDWQKWKIKPYHNTGDRAAKRGYCCQGKKREIFFNLDFKHFELIALFKL